MTPDEQIQLAERIAKDLPEVSRNLRNEWMRWMGMASQCGMEQAIRHAERLSTDITMRPAIQRANRLIAQAVKGQLGTLQRLRPEEQRAVLGYVAWWLRILAEETRQERPAKPRRQHQPRR
ncbi:MAG: hypothetical protein ACUVST_14040 [Anaerolineae bacterium]